MGYFSIKDLATTNKVLTQPKPLEKLKFGCTGEKVKLKNGSDETIHFSIFHIYAFQHFPISMLGAKFTKEMR